MKRLTKEQWRAAKVSNSWEIAELGGGRVFIGYRPRDVRMGTCPGWLVDGIGFEPDPGGHWANYGAKFFDGRKHPGDIGLQQAKDWAAKKYGIGEWIRDPWGDWQDAKAFARATAKAARP